MARPHLTKRQLRCPVDSSNRDALYSKLVDHDVDLDSLDAKMAALDTVVDVNTATYQMQPVTATWPCEELQQGPLYDNSRGYRRGCGQGLCCARQRCSQ